MRMLELDVPEYFVTKIGRAEKIGCTCVRFRMCAENNGLLIPRYDCVWPIDCVLSRGELSSIINNAMVWPDGATH